MGIIGDTISMGSLKNKTPKPPEERTKEEEEERERSRRKFGTRDFTELNRSADAIFDTAWKLTKFEEYCDKCGESTGGEAYECNGCQEVLCPDCMSEGHSGANYDEWADEKVVDGHESGFHVGVPQTRAQLADEHMSFATSMNESAGNICRDCLENYDMQEKDAINQANDDMREANEDYQTETRREPLDSQYTGKNMSQEEKDALTQERIDRLAEKTVDAQMRMRYPKGPFGSKFDPMKYASEDKFDTAWNSIRKV
jgi:hypothetical protein